MFEEGKGSEHSSSSSSGGGGGEGGRGAGTNSGNDELMAELIRHRDELYSSFLLSSASHSTSHGVPTLVKTLDAAAWTLKLARSIDARLQNSPKINAFFTRLEEAERDCVRYARQGFGHVKVLVVEGLAGSGKSTLANRLRVITRGTAITDLPPALVEVRGKSVPGVCPIDPHRPFCRPVSFSLTLL
jgi:hypothetical protein